jgi:hypothetical protein
MMGERGGIDPLFRQYTDQGEASAILKRLAQHPGYSYVPIAEDWHTLCGPFFKRLFGAKQVTDAYLLGLAVRNGLILVTMDKGIVYLAGSEFSGHILLLEVLSMGG